MTRPAGVSPERLAELADGAPPGDAAERELMALMSEVRDLETTAPDALRARVRTIAAGESEPGRVRWWHEGRRRLLVVAAPVAVGVVALAIAIPAMTGGSGDTAPAGAVSEALQADSAAPAAPEAQADSARAVAPSVAGSPAPGSPTARLRLEVGGAAALTDAVRRARAEVRTLGGTTVSAPGGAGVRRLVVRVPADRAEEALAALGRLGMTTGLGESLPVGESEVTIRVTITTGG